MSEPKRFRYFSDPGHAWLEVPRAFLKEIGILDRVSAYSYQSESGRMVYLEEDDDMSRFGKAMASRGLVFQNVDMPVDNDESWIRQLEPFDPKFVERPERNLPILRHRRVGDRGSSA